VKAFRRSIVYVSILDICALLGGPITDFSFPFQLEDVALQILQNGTYLDLESTLEEQADVLDGFPDRYMIC
jgi:hypothetical protein